MAASDPSSIPIGYHQQLRKLGTWPDARSDTHNMCTDSPSCDGQTMAGTSMPDNATRCPRRSIKTILKDVCSYEGQGCMGRGSMPFAHLLQQLGKRGLWRPRVKPSAYRQPRSRTIAPVRRSRSEEEYPCATASRAATRHEDLPDLTAHSHSDKSRREKWPARQERSKVSS